MQLPVVFEPRHEWNVGTADIETHLRKQRGDLTAMMRLMIEHVRDEHPTGGGPCLSVDSAAVGQGLCEPRVRERCCPGEQSRVESFPLLAKLRKASEKVRS